MNIKIILLAILLLLPSILLSATIEESVQKIKTGDVGICGEGLRELIDKGAEAIPALISLLDNQAKTVKIVAMIGLGRIRDEKAIKPIINKLKTDKDVDVRYAAAGVLGYFNTPESSSVLKRALYDPNHKVQVIAACALGMHGDNSGYDIAEKAALGNDNSVKKDAITALGYIGDEKGRPILEQAKNNPGTKNEASVALKQLEIVQSILENPKRAKSVRLEKLKEALNDNNSTVSQWALDNLLIDIDAKDKETMQFLKQAAKNKSNKESRSIIKELKRRGIETEEGEK
ncbi:MAG: HEAT repeat domain-containing protein, partial [bacterium]|nr:HEAT repeat domain-containing protein [bacterium]